MSNKNAMARVSQQFQDIKSLLGVSYNVFELHGKDERSSYHNERGYTKAVMSDFLRVFNSIDKTYSFSFAFNNPEREDCGGVIVSARVNKNQDYLRAYLNFADFKTGLNNLVKAMKLTVNSSDRLDYPKMHELMVQTFKLEVNELNLDDFVNELVENLKQTQAEYEAVAKTIDTCKEKIIKAKDQKNKEEFKTYKKEMREVIDGSTLQIRRIKDFYRNLVQINKDKLMQDKPYLSSRLVGHLCAPAINSSKVINLDLKFHLLEALDIQSTFSSRSELYSD